MQKLIRDLKKVRHSSCSSFLSVFQIFESLFGCPLLINNSTMNIQEKCSQCLLVFAQGSQLGRLPSCEHHICGQCLEQAISSCFDMVVCSLCSLESPKEGLKNQQIESNTPQAQITPTLTQQGNDDQTEGLLLQPDSGQPQDEAKSCPTHNILMDIICVSDKVRICPHCALFGEHKDHRFKRIQDFEKETKEKMKIFAEILIEKRSYLEKTKEETSNQLEKRLKEGKEKTKEEVERWVQCFVGWAKKKGEKICEEVDSTFAELEKYCQRLPIVKKKVALDGKLGKWEDECSKVVEMLKTTDHLEKRLSYYYNSSLELAPDGALLLEELRCADLAASQIICDKIKEVKVLVDSEMQGIIGKSLRLERFSEQAQWMEIGESNAFLDCTSSEIGLNSMDTAHNNHSIEMDLTSIANSCKLIDPVITKQPKQEIRSLKSIDRRDSKPLLNRKKVASPAAFQTVKNSRVSETRSPVRTSMMGSLKSILPGTQVKSSEIKEPEKIYAEFSRNTRTDFFDISECNLASDQVVEYVQRARRVHKIRGLKLASNHLTTQGFERMLQSLQGVGNINLANNELTQGVFDLLLRNRDRLDALKIINLSHNPISFDKKTGGKVEQLKRMGIIVIL